MQPNIQAQNGVDINVWMTSERVMMEIHDNGKGFDLEKNGDDDWPC